MRILFVSMCAVLTLVSGCEQQAETEVALIGCEAPEHEGLLCWTMQPGDIGRCVEGICAPLGCASDSECVPAACYTGTCVKSPVDAPTGSCLFEIMANGQTCSDVSVADGLCSEGKCFEAAQRAPRPAFPR